MWAPHPLPLTPKSPSHHQHGYHQFNYPSQHHVDSDDKVLFVMVRWVASEEQEPARSLACTILQAFWVGEGTWSLL